MRKFAYWIVGIGPDGEPTYTKPVLVPVFPAETVEGVQELVRQRHPGTEIEFGVATTCWSPR